MILRLIQKIKKRRYRFSFDKILESRDVFSPAQDPAFAGLRFEILFGDYAGVIFKLYGAAIVEDGILLCDYDVTYAPEKYGKVDNDSIYEEVHEIVHHFITTAPEDDRESIV